MIIHTHVSLPAPPPHTLISQTCSHLSNEHSIHSTCMYISSLRLSTESHENDYQTHSCIAPGASSHSHVSFTLTSLKYTQYSTYTYVSSLSASLLTHILTRTNNYSNGASFKNQEEEEFVVGFENA